jgi:hypothetical protein
MVPPHLRGRLESAEIFHEILVHRWYLSENAGHEVDTKVAARSYIEKVLSKRPEEAVAAGGEDPDLLLPPAQDTGEIAAIGDELL